MFEHVKARRLKRAKETEVSLSEQAIRKMVDEALSVIGDTLAERRGRVSLYLPCDDRETLVGFRRWSNTGFQDIRDRHFRSGIAVKLAFQSNEHALSLPADNWIPKSALKSLETMRQWHQVEAKLDANDAAKLSKDMLRVAAIDCVKVSGGRQNKVLAIITLDVMDRALKVSRRREIVKQMGTLAKLLAVAIDELEGKLPTRVTSATVAAPSAVPAPPSGGPPAA